MAMMCDRAPEALRETCSVWVQKSRCGIDDSDQRANWEGCYLCGPSLIDCELVARWIARRGEILRRRGDLNVRSNDLRSETLRDRKPRVQLWSWHPEQHVARLRIHTTGQLGGNDWKPPNRTTNSFWFLFLFSPLLHLTPPRAEASKMRWLLSFLLLGFWGAVHALSSSGNRLLVVLEEDKGLYSTFWEDLEGKATANLGLHI